jgi:hypothetical protein
MINDVKITIIVNDPRITKAESIVASTPSLKRPRITWKQFATSTFQVQTIRTNVSAPRFFMRL